MDEAITRRVEATVDMAAAALFGIAVAWASAQVGAVPVLAGSSGLTAMGLAFAALRQVRPAAVTWSMAGFETVDVQPSELILTDADRVLPATQELLLDDALSPPDPDSRVVRLFDASAMPTPGELKARIDRHLAVPQSAPPDASQALFEALAELRSSLR